MPQKRARTVDVHERLPLREALPLSLQHLFAMFGATVLVPWLVGLDPSVTLFTSGVGTLLYIVTTKAKVPAYLGSSFAFIAALQAILGVQPGQLATPDRIAVAMGGCVAVGVLYVAAAALIARFGTGWVDKLLPPVVIGSVVIVIGLGLAGVAVNMASQGAGNVPQRSFFLVAMVALSAAILASMFGRGFVGVIPVLVGIIVGYGVAAALGQVSFEPIRSAKVLAVPPFVLPRFTVSAILSLLPISLVVITEHIGHLVVTRNVVGRDFLKEPGLHRSLAGDGFATALSGFLGGPPNTTYGENIGVMAITRVFSIWVIGGAAVIAIALSFVPKVAALIQSIPVQVMGGISILLFGIIAAAGVRMLVEAKVNFAHKRNLLISSVVLVLGIGGATVKIAGVELHGMALATWAGIILNLILPGREEASVAADAVSSSPDV